MTRAKEFLGEEMTVRQLRMIPYIQYCLTNNQNIDPNKINADERAVLMDWQEKGYLERPSTALAVTKAFWDFMNEVLWVSYVNYDGEMLPEKETTDVEG